MGISASDFENAPPSSLDKGANERVNKSISARKRGKDTFTVTDKYGNVFERSTDASGLMSDKLNEAIARNDAARAKYESDLSAYEASRSNIIRQNANTSALSGLPSFRDPFAAQAAQASRDKIESNINKTNAGYGFGGTFSNPFFSGAGQKERLKRAGTNVGLALISPFNKDVDLKVNRSAIGNEKVASTVERAANNPFVTAGVATAGFYGGKIVAGGVKAGSTALAGTRVGGAVTAARGTRVGGYLWNLGGGVVQGAAAVKGSIAVGRGLGSASERDLLRSSGFQDAYRDALIKERDALAEQTSFGIGNRGFSARSLAFDISAGISNRKDVFYDSINEYAKVAGIDPDLAASAARRERGSRVVGEALGFLAVSRKAESVGRANVARAFERSAGQSFASRNAFGTVFKKTFVPIGLAGSIEGFSAETTQAIARNRDTDLKRLGIASGAGFVSAGLIGGTIAGLKPNKPVSSGLVEGIASFADPFEKPGDLLQDVFEFGAKKAGRRIPVTALSFSGGDAFTFVPTSSSNTVSNVAGGKSFSFANTFTPVPSTTPKNSFSSFLPSFNFNPSTNTNVPVLSNNNVPTNPFSFSTTSNTNTNVNTNVNTNTFISTNIPSVTPKLRIPPPLPLNLDFGGSGSGGFGLGLRKGFVNELDAGLSIFGIGKSVKRGGSRVKKR